MWIILAFAAALSESLKDIFSKAGLKNCNEYVLAWALRFFALFFLLPFLFFIKIPAIGAQFYQALFISGILNVIAAIFYMKAIKDSDLSLVTPLVTFTPLFLLLTSFLILGELPSYWGAMGVTLIVIGSYVLNINKKSDGYFAPFKALFKEKGSRLMLTVAFIWSISSSFDKIGVKNSSPMFWVIAVNIFIAFLMSLWVAADWRKNSNTFLNVRMLKFFIPIGLCVAVGSIAQMSAIALTNVSYVIAIKRTSVIMGAVLACWIFKEDGFKKRILGILLMVAGVALITLFNK